MLGIALIAFGEEIGADLKLGKELKSNILELGNLCVPLASSRQGAEMACRSIDHILQYGELTLRLASRVMCFCVYLIY